MTEPSKEDRAYKLMLMLDRLESLLEDMDELGIASRDQLVAEIAHLHAQIDELEG